MRFSIALTILLFGIQGALAQTERAYGVYPLQPTWVQLMYAPNPDPGAVIAAHDLFYAKHPLVKNEHTQYYKRWIRSFSRENNFDPTSANNQAYVARSLAYQNQKAPNSDWQCIGPRDFDVDAASRSYAPVQRMFIP